MAAPLSKSLSYVLDWLLPPVCPATGQDVDVHGTVAADYWASLRFIRAPFCRQCAMPFPHEIGGDNPICAACLDNPPAFRAGRAALIYDDASRKLILRFKHGDQLQAVRTLVPWLREAGAELLAGADVLIPVPLHRWRLLKRRYNQSALLAQALGKATGKPVLMHALRRVRATPPQGGLKRAERLSNVKNAFLVADAGAILDKAVVLVDDVFTTGATLDACARALLNAGAKSVDVLAVARVVKDM
jgi:ComF family protein